MKGIPPPDPPLHMREWPFVLKAGTPPDPAAQEGLQLGCGGVKGRRRITLMRYMIDPAPKSSARVKLESGRDVGGLMGPAGTRAGIRSSR